MSGDTTTALAALRERGRAIVAAATGAGMTMRLTGGIAVRERCPVPPDADLDDRVYHDIDLVGRLREARGYDALFTSLGYEADRAVNTLFGTVRRVYHHPGGHHVDVFMDRLDFCHRIELEHRLDLHPLTLTPADLLLGKIQIVERNRKDLIDAALLLHAHDMVAGDPGALEVDRILALTSDDWGLCTTASDFLAALRASLTGLGFSPAAAIRIDDRAGSLAAAIAGAPKSLRWRTRDRVGRRVRWYKTVEEVL
jgi:hypothetical protein